MTDAFNYTKTFGSIPIANDPYEGVYNSIEECSNDSRY